MLPIYCLEFFKKNWTKRTNIIAVIKLTDFKMNNPQLKKKCFLTNQCYKCLYSSDFSFDFVIIKIDKTSLIVYKILSLLPHLVVVKMNKYLKRNANDKKRCTSHSSTHSRYQIILQFQHHGFLRLDRHQHKLID